MSLFAAFAAAVGGNLADVWDDLLPLLCALAALAAVAGWAVERRASSGRPAEAEAQRERLAQALEKQQTDVGDREDAIRAGDRELVPRGEELAQSRPLARGQGRRRRLRPRVPPRLQTTPGTAPWPRVRLPKIGISERILLKPGPLTKEERSAIEMHPLGSRANPCWVSAPSASPTAPRCSMAGDTCSRRPSPRRALVQRRPFAVVLIELTGLAELNHRHGYAAGDAAIHAAARIVQRAAGRSGAIACRYGGPRLGVAMPGAGSEAGEALAFALGTELEAHGTDTATGAAAWQSGESGEDVVARARLGLAVSEAAASGA